MVIKEWHCNGCGKDFDSDIAVCGWCGATEPHVVRAFRTPPGFKGDKTKLLDTSLKNFTSQYGLSDFSNNASSAHEKKYMGPDGKPISLEETWKPANQVVSAPDPGYTRADGVQIPGESRADLIRNLAKDAATPVGSKKVVIAKDRQAVAR